MVTIRLARHGAKKKPFYHITVADRRAKRDGRFIERVGFFNPLPQGQDEALRVNLMRVDYWLSEGAQPSDRVRQLIRLARKQPVPPPEPSPIADEAPTDEGGAAHQAEGMAGDDDVDDALWKITHEFTFVSFDEGGEKVGPNGDHRLVCVAESGEKVAIWGSQGESREHHFDSQCRLAVRRPLRNASASRLRGTQLQP